MNPFALSKFEGTVFDALEAPIQNQPPESVLLESQLKIDNLSAGRKRFFYDVRGNLFRIENNTQGRQEVTERAYDESGRLTREVFDDGPNRDREYVAEYKYDRKGRLSTIDASYTEGRGRVARQERDTFIYDNEDNIRLRFIDTGADGNLSDIRSLDESDEVIKYDERGNTIVVRRGFFQGIPQQVIRSSYDTNNNLIRETISFQDDPGPDVIITYSYDGIGNLVSETYAAAPLYTPNVTEYQTLPATATTPKTVIATQKDPSTGEPSYIETSAFDDRGNLIRETFDTFGDGVADGVNRYVYNARDQIRRQTNDFIPGDGVTDNIVTNIYGFIPSERLYEKAE